MKLKEMKNTAVHVPKKEEYDELMQIYEDAGWTWYGGGKPKEFVFDNRWTYVWIENHFCCKSKHYYEGKNYKFLTLQEFKEAQGLVEKKAVVKEQEGVMKVEVGKKYRVKNPDVCCSYSNESDYIIIIEIELDEVLTYNIFNKDGQRIDFCYSCFKPSDLLPYEEELNKVEEKNKFKVGDRVKILKAVNDTDKIGETRSVVAIDDDDVYLEGCKNGWDVHAGWLKLVQKSAPPQTDKKPLPELPFSITEVEGEQFEECADILEGRGLEKISRWRDPGEYIININSDGEFFSAPSDISYVGRINAQDFLSTHGDKPSRIDEVLREGGEKIKRSSGLALGDVAGVDPHWDTPENDNNPVKNKKKDIMSALRTLSKRISLGKPETKYYKLGWIEIEDGEVTTTQRGRTASCEYLLLGHSSLEDYADSETKRIKKEEKEGK